MKTKIVEKTFETPLTIKQKKQAAYDKVWGDLLKTPRSKMLAITPEKGENNGAIFAALYYRSKQTKHEIGCMKKGGVLCVFNK